MYYITLPLKYLHNLIRSVYDRALVVSLFLDSGQHSFHLLLQ